MTPKLDKGYREDWVFESGPIAWTETPFRAGGTVRELQKDCSNRGQDLYFQLLSSRTLNEDNTMTYLRKLDGARCPAAKLARHA